MKLFSGSANRPLAEAIAKKLGIRVSPTEIFIFPDGERRIQFQETVVDEDVVIVQSTNPPVDAHYMELFFMIDAAKRSGARSVTLVMPYMGYMRQDHIFRSGEAVSVEVVIRILESLGLDRCIALDLHTVKIPEMFSISFTEVSGITLFAEEIKKRGWETDSVLVSPDMGGLRRIEKMSSLLGNMPWIATVKDRDVNTGAIQINTISGDKNNIKKRALIVDDMISSGKTIAEAAKLLQAHGVAESYVFVTHPIFSAEAPKLLQESLVKGVFVTDGVLIPNEKQFQKLHILSLAPAMAAALSR